MIEILLLGPLQIRVDGKPISNLSLSKVQALLAYLVAESTHAHRREALAGLLWPDYTESSARVNLRQTLKRLRQALPAEIIVATRQTVGINPDFSCRLDLAEFAMLREEYRRAGSIESLKQAVQLYRGDFLEQLWVEDCAAFEEWVLLKSEWLRREMLDALYKLTAHRLEANQFDEAAQFARQQVELDLLNERAYQQLMQALAQSGQRMEALQQFETCRRVLQDELDSAPSRATVVLAEQIRSGSLDEEGARQIVLESSLVPQAFVHNLPHLAMPILGREQEIVALNALLSDGDSRLITITGPGGMGKTRLALATMQQLVEQMQDAFREASTPSPLVQKESNRGSNVSMHGIYFVPLQALSDIEAIATAIADAINLHFSSRAAPQQQLINYLKQKQILLLLDNFEHLLGGADLLLDLLQNCPHLHLLITSRTRLNLHQEQLFALNGLTFPQASTHDADTYPAVHLFLQTAQRIRHDFVMDEEALSQVTLICQRVEGMPLAIELAASWVSTLPVQEIAQTVVNSLESLSSTARNLPDRHRNMRVVFDITWQQMNEEEQRLFAALSIFRGGFTRGAAEQIADATMPRLADLVNKSLIRYEPAQDRYNLHELLRQYGQEKMQKLADAEDRVRGQHSKYYCTWLAAQEHKLQGMDRSLIQMPLSAEYDNICQAWEWAVNRKRLAITAEWLQHAVSSFGLLMMRMARYHEGAMRFEQALQQLELPDSTREIDVVYHYVFAWLLICYADHLHFLGNGAKANSLLLQSLEILQGPLSQMRDTRVAQAAALNCLGDTTYGEEGRACYQQALNLAREAGDRWIEARVLLSLSELLGLESLASAETVNNLAQQSLEIHRDVGDSSGVAWNLETIGELAVVRGHVEAGRRALNESMQIRQHLNLPFGVARCHSKLGHLEVVTGQNERASQHFRQAVDIWTELSLPTAAAHDLCFQAVPLLHAGNYEAAYEAVMGAHQLLHDNQTLSDVFDRAYRVLGLLALAKGENHAALEYLQSSVKSTVFRAPQAYSLCALALAARRLNSTVEARQYLDGALQGTQQAENYFLALQALNAATLLLADAGDIEYARKLHTWLMKQPFSVNSRWVADVITGPLEQTIHAAKSPNVLSSPPDKETLQWVSKTRETCQALCALIQIGMMNR